MNPPKQLIVEILRQFQGRLYRTSLVKLAYLADYAYYRNHGRTISGLQYMWDQFGPNAVSNAIVIEGDELASEGIIGLETEPNYYGEPSYLYRLAKDMDPGLSPDAEYVVREVVAQYGQLSVGQLTTVSKQTRPFERAQKYTVLTMDQDTPAEAGDPATVTEYKETVAKTGLKSLAEIKAEHGLA